MPEPSVLAGYEQVLPGAAERILRAYESVTVDASARDDRIVDAEIWIRKNGAGWVYFFAFLVVVATIVLFFMGKYQGGIATIAGTVILGVVSMVTGGRVRSHGKKDES